MRMRKLGKGQSVMFLAPPDIDRIIRKASNKRTLDTITTLDVLRWSMLETCKDIERHAPQFLMQGISFKRRDSVSLSDPTSRVRAAWEEQEARTLEELYEPGHQILDSPIGQ